jgi:protein-L-isoaspartate O-methyltransferase
MEALIRELIETGALKTKRVIDAFISVKREEFVPEQFRILYP